MNIVCSKCQRPFVERVAPNGLREYLLSRLHVYPLCCQICRHRFHLLLWGAGYEGIPADRRRYKRLPVDLPVTLRWEYGDHAGTTIDLSMGGCSIEAAAPVLVGTLVSLEIEAFEHEPPITVGTAVVRSTTTWRVGLEFLNLSSENEERLSRFMVSLWMGGSPIACAEPACTVVA